MMKTVTQHLGRVVRGLALSIALGCAHKPPFEPKEDYGQYPGWEPETALHNLQGILKESCGESSVGPQGIYCEVRHCLRWVSGVDRDVYTGTMRTSNYCGDWDEFETRFGWEEVGNIEVSGTCVRIQDRTSSIGMNLGRSVHGCTLYAPTAEKAQSIKLAIEKYRAHRDQ